MVTGDAVREYRARADHQPALAYGCTVNHAAIDRAAFRIAGYRSRCVHGGLPAGERDALIQGLATGEVEVLTSCDLICEGLDVPSVGGVILLRPTESFALAMQQIGRGMRPAEGKDAPLRARSRGKLSQARPAGKRARMDARRRAEAKSRPGAGWRCEACGLLNGLDDDRCEALRRGAARSAGVASARGGRRRIARVHRRRGRSHRPDAVSPIPGPAAQRARASGLRGSAWLQRRMGLAPLARAAGERSGVTTAPGGSPAKQRRRKRTCRTVSTSTIRLP